MNQPKTTVINKSKKAQSVWGHLDELRGRVIKSVLAMLVLSVIFYGMTGRVLDFLVKPVGKLVFTSPADAFLAHICLALLGGFFLAFPIILYQVWTFIASALKKDERKYIVIFAPCSFALFFIGLCFAYFITVPFSLHFLLGFSSENVVPMITINHYVSFLGVMLLAFGVIFELPLVLMFLVKIGIATPAFLIQKRRYAVVLILVLSALITPPDFITQLILAGPLLLLYEIGILASKMVYKE